MRCAGAVVALAVVVVCAASGVVAVDPTPAATGVAPTSVDSTPVGWHETVPADAPVTGPLSPLRPSDRVVVADRARRQTADQPTTDATVTRVAVHANGSATWTVEIRTLITNDTDVEDYRRFQERFRNETDEYLGSFRERMQRLVAQAGTVTGREMRATDFRGRTRIEESPRRWGVVEYTFRWEGFAAREGDALVVGDVFQSGYYLTGGDSLVIEAPENYAVETVAPSPDDGGVRVVRWSGPIDFGDERPRVRMVERVTQAGEGTDGGDGTDDGDSAVGTMPLDDDLSLVALFGLAVLGVGGTYLAYVRRRDPAGTGAASRDGSPAATETGETDGSGTAGSDAGSGAAARVDATPEGGTGADADETGTPPADGELLTDEERVVSLLERNDGRMKQSAIAERFDWSASKTSRVLSTMADEGAVQKLRLGNENVIDLPEE